MFRFVLVSGLIVHKLIWELLKRQDAPAHTHADRPKSVPVQMVKAAKVGALAFIICQATCLNILPISRRPTVLRYVGIGTYIIGLLTAILGRVQLGRSWANIEDYQVKPDQTVVTSGLYRFIRHPIYLGDALLIIGLELTLNSWLVLGSLVPLTVIVKQAAAEESLLAQRLPQYAAYRQRTKKFIPFVL